MVAKPSSSGETVPPEVELLLDDELDELLLELEEELEEELPLEDELELLDDELELLLEDEPLEPPPNPQKTAVASPLTVNESILARS